jgi:hypothetical protein
MRKQGRFKNALRFDPQRGTLPIWEWFSAGDIEREGFNNALRLAPEIVDTKKQLEVIRAQRADH